MLPTYHFDCSWLSDYPEERESLFIQGGANLSMVNIRDMDCTEYKYILEALQQIDDIINDSNKGEVSLTVLEELIIENQIAKERDDLGFEKIETLNDYASALINHWFKMQTECYINWGELNEYKWISTICLNVLFPSIEKIGYYNIGKDNVDGLLLGYCICFSEYKIESFSLFSSIILALYKLS